MDDHNYCRYQYYFLFLSTTLFSNKVSAVFKKDSVWAVPALCKSEFRNVLTLYLRKGIISLQQALTIQEEAEAMLADNEFVALALQLSANLITEDKKTRREFPETAISLDEFLSSE